MSVTVRCDGTAPDGLACDEDSPFMGEDYAGGRYVYTLPNRWTRTDEGHYCPRCSRKQAR